MEDHSQDIIELRHLEIENYVHLRNSMNKACEQTGLRLWKEEDLLPHCPVRSMRLRHVCSDLLFAVS
jgi:hypothetical protein